MKKIYTLFFVLFLHNITHAEIFNFWDELNHQTTIHLSELQNFQLAYLHDELQKYQEAMQTEWILNQNVRTILEIMELSVQQSSPQTQTLFQQKIVQMFQNFNIDIYFTNDGLIKKINKTAEQYSNNSSERLTKHPSKKLTFHHHHAGKSQTKKSKTPDKIKGANRTRKKLEKAWKERKEAAQKQAQEAQRKRETLKKSKEPTPADSMAQKIWEEQMEQHKTRMNNSPKNDEEPKAIEIPGEL